MASPREELLALVSEELVFRGLKTQRHIRALRALSLMANMSFDMGACREALAILRGEQASEREG